MSASIAAHKPRVLVVDDHQEMAETVADGLSARGFDAVAVATAEEALTQIASGKFEALVSDLRIPGTDGLELLAFSRAKAPENPVIMMTAFSGIDTAIESIRRGAYHYLTKPFKVEELAIFLRRALDESAVRREARVLRSALQGSLKGIVGTSSAMREIYELVRRVADSNAPVLLLGETGTGKGLIARALHAESARSSESFVAVNCAALPEALLESELFGHVKGAFTGATSDRIGLFEQAHRGTIFLDEIGEMGPALQAKLLDVLETGRVRPVGSSRERQIDARIISATHRDLQKRVTQGHFRQDLLYRLDVIPVEIPPLRLRTEDLPVLVSHFLTQAQARHPQSTLKGISSEAMDVLASHSWPGNVRELEHLVERLVLLCPNTYATAKDLPKALTHKKDEPERLAFGDSVLPIRELQRRYAAWALQKLGGAKMATCEALGVDSKTLAKWLRKDTSDE